MPSHAVVLQGIWVRAARAREGVWAIGQVQLQVQRLAAGGSLRACDRLQCDALMTCHMQLLRAPGGVPVLRIMLQVQMVTPHLVHVLSQSLGTVPMRQRGDRYV